MKIANKINFSFSAALAILIGSSLFAFYGVARNNLEKAVFEHLITTAQSRANHIETFLKELEEEAEIFAKSALMKSMLEAVVSNNPDSAKLMEQTGLELEQFVKTDRHLYEIFVINQQGRIIVSTDENVIGLDKSTDAYFLGAKAGVYVKDAYYSETTKKYSIAISAPVLDDKTSGFLGVIVTRIRLEQLDKITADRTGLGETGETYLVNKDKYIITHSRFTEGTFLGQKIDTENLRDCCANETKGDTCSVHEEVSVYADYRGINVLGTHVFIPEMGWMLLAEIDEKEALAPLARMEHFAIIVFCFALAIVYVISILISKAITAPIHKLHKGTEKIGAGDLDYKVGSDAKDEIGQLSRAFDQMTGNLQKTTASRDELDAANQQLRAHQQQLKAANQQLDASNQQLRAIEQQLRASNQQLQAGEQQLKASNQQLNASNQQLRAKEQQLLSLNHNLNERVKELNCLYGLSKCVEIPNITLPEIFQGLAEMLPPSWQYPQITCGRVIFDGNEFKTDNFKETQWLQSADIKVFGEKKGSIDVYYLRECPLLDEGPFLKEERDLINALAERLSRVIERKQAEELQKRLVAIIEATPDFVGFADAKDKHIIYVNKAGRKMCGIGNDEDVTKLKISDVHPEWTNKMFAEEILPAVVRDGVWTGECAFLNIRDRHEIPVLMVLSSHKAPDGEVTVFSTISRDITERKQAEGKIRIFSSAVESAYDSFVLTDMNGNVSYANKSCIKNFGYSPEEITKLNVSQFTVNPEDAKKIIEEIKKKGRWDGELMQVRKNKERFSSILTTSLVKDDKGKPAAIMGIFRDITERKKTEEVLVELNKDLKATIEKLSAANRELHEFAHITAHDLKAPLRGIGTLAELLVTDYADKFDDEGKKSVHMLMNRLNRMYRQIDDILKYSEIGRVVVKKSEVDLNTLIEEIKDSIAVPENIKVIIDGNLPKIICEKTRMMQVFQNLISNAIESMDKPAGLITASCTEEGDRWKFSVTDNGPGIDERHFERIFKIFQTLATNGANKSTGIGLAIVKKIVESYGGRVWVESEVGQGSTFLFTLPKQRQPQEALING